MAANSIAAQISKALPEETDQAIHLIAALTGENPAKLAKMSKDELFTFLGFLLKCRKEQIQNLLREHDQNTSLDAVSLAKLWKLVAKHSMPGKKRLFATLDEKVYEDIRIRTARLSDQITRKIELGEALQKTSIPSGNKVPALVNMQKVLHRLNLLSAANSNVPQQTGLGH
ncbi:MAG: hypothetical protein ACHP6I_00740 [Rickettsiales bacterium]